MSKDQIRQGDVLLKRISKLPEDVTEKNKTIAYGELTGHHHRFENKEARVFRNDQGTQYVQLDLESELIHEEHENLMVPAGTYQVVIQRELDLMNQRIRNVVD
jgi:hypothetical protein